MGLILYIASLIGKVLLIPFLLLYSIVKKIYKKKFFKEAYPDLNKKFRTMAVSIDMYGNVVGADFFNDWFIKDPTIHPYGKPKETISEATGWNKYYDNLTKWGKRFDSFLNIFDENHSLKTIGK
jgi:hypothetical protein